MHIHVRVWNDGAITRTSQLYFSADLTERVMQLDPYAEFGLPDTPNDDDFLIGDYESDGTLLREPTRPIDGAGLTLLTNLGV